MNQWPESRTAIVPAPVWYTNEKLCWVRKTRTFASHARVSHHLQFLEDDVSPVPNTSYRLSSGVAEVWIPTTVWSRLTGGQTASGSDLGLSIPYLSATSKSGGTRHPAAAAQRSNPAARATVSTETLLFSSRCPRIGRADEASLPWSAKKSTVIVATAMSFIGNSRAKYSSSSGQYSGVLCV